MATVNETTVPQSSQEGSANGVLIQWAHLANGDDGRRIVFQDYADRSVQVAGVFGGASVTIEGSNDGTNWASLHDPSSAALVIATPKISAVLELTRYLRPTVAGGGGTTDLTVSMLVRIPRQ